MALTIAPITRDQTKPRRRVLTDAERQQQNLQNSQNLAKLQGPGNQALNVPVSTTNSALPPGEIATFHRQVDSGVRTGPTGGLNPAFTPVERGQQPFGNIPLVQPLGQPATQDNPNGGFTNPNAGRPVGSTDPNSRVIQGPGAAPSQQGQAIQSNLRGQRDALAQGLQGDLKAEEAARRRILESQAQESRERLARTFATSPTGGIAGSGTGQREFEFFERGVVQAGDQITADIQARTAETQRANLQALSQIVSQDEAQQLAELNARVERAIQIGNATGQYVDPETGATIQTLAAEAQQFGFDVTEAGLTGEFRGTQTQQARLQQIQEALAIAEQTGFFTDPTTGAAIPVDTLQREAQALQAEIQRAGIEIQKTEQRQRSTEFLTGQTGVIGGGRPVTAQDFGIDISNIGNPEDGTLDIGNYLAGIDQVLQVAPFLSGEQAADLLLGRSITPNLQPTLAGRAQAFEEGIRQREIKIAEDQNLLDQTNAALQRAIQQGQQTGSFVDPVTGETQETLDVRRLDLEEEIQRDRVAIDRDRQTLAEEQESARQREEFARQTGAFGGRSISATDLGLNIASIFDPTTGEFTGDFDAFFALADVIDDNFQEAVGRNATPEELNAIFQGQAITLPATETLAKQLQDTQLQLEQARVTGDFEGERTLAAQELDLQERLADEENRLREAELFGSEGSFTARDFGFDIGLFVGENGQFIDELGRPLDQLPPGRLQVFFNAVDEFERRFQDTFGRRPTIDEAETLLSGGRIDGRQTLAAQQFEAEQGLTRELAAGLVNVGGGFTQTLDRLQFEETARQFDETLTQQVNEFAAQFGLDEQQTQAVVGQINQQILNDTRALSADIGAQWAQIFGTSGLGSQPISAVDLGVDVSPFAGAPLDNAQIRASAEGQAMIASYQALTGQDPDDQTLRSLFEGQTVTVDGVPTLEAREFASRVTQQNMDRIVNERQAARQFGLDERAFERASLESDRTWNLTTLDVASVVGIEPNRFRATKFALDGQIADAEEAIRQAQASGLDTSGMVTPETLIGNAARDFQRDGYGSVEQFLRANDLFDQRFGNAQRDIARRNNMEDITFAQARRQADFQERQMFETWGSIFDERDPDTKQLTEFPELSQRIEQPLIALANRVGFATAPNARANLLLQSDDPEIQRQLLQLRNDLEQDVGPMNETMWTENLNLLMEPAVIALGQRQQGNFVPMNFENITLNHVRKDWFTHLGRDEQEALLALINGGNLSPERQSVSSSQQLGQAITQIATAFAGSAFSGVFNGQVQPNPGP